MVPVAELVSWSISTCMSVAVTPDLFMVDVRNVAISVASPLVPVVGVIMELPAIMPPIKTGVLPIMPFMTPSDASFVMAVTMLDEEVIPLSFAD
jgi:hypothetical protein